MKEELNALAETAKAKVAAFPAAEQVVVIKTAQDNVYAFANDVLSKGEEDERTFLKGLCDKGETELAYVVCVWKNGGVEIPAMHFLKLILEADPKNAKTRLAVEGENGIEECVLEACL